MTTTATCWALIITIKIIVWAVLEAAQLNTVHSLSLFGSKMRSDVRLERLSDEGAVAAAEAVDLLGGDGIDALHDEQLETATVKFFGCGEQPLIEVVLR